MKQLREIHVLILTNPCMQQIREIHVFNNFDKSNLIKIHQEQGRTDSGMDKAMQWSEWVR